MTNINPANIPGHPNTLFSGHPANAHNPDRNTKWTPLIGRRVYACQQCGAEHTVSTNHIGTVWAERCSGTCRTIVNPHTAREVVLPYRGPHIYVREAD